MREDTTIPFRNPALRDELSGLVREGAQRIIRQAVDREELLAFYDFPAAHWRSLRTTNPIESTFATIRMRSARGAAGSTWGACASSPLPSSV